MSRVLLALGSNVGDRAGALAGALTSLEANGVRIVARGQVIETEAWTGDQTAEASTLPRRDAGVGAGGPPRGNAAPGLASAEAAYLNQVVEVETELDPWELFELAKRIERELGRPSREPRNAPRVLDIDLLAWLGTTIRSSRLSLPHPRLAGRSFLDEPLATLASAAEFLG